MKQIIKDVAIFVILLIIFSFLFSLFSDKSKVPEQALSAEKKIINASFDKDNFSHANELHWGHMPLSYKIFNCSGYQSRRIIRAFNTLENETNYKVSFILETNITELDETAYYIQGSKEADIEVICYAEFKVANLPGYNTLGEANYLSSPYNSLLIKRAFVNFYGITSTTYTSGCTIYPDVELHEILHGFGFDHVNQTNHIMNPRHVSCQTRLNDDTLQRLLQTYTS